MVFDNTQPLIESGVASLVWERNNHPHLPREPTSCLMWVQVVRPDDGSEIVQVVVCFPPHYNHLRFPVSDFVVDGESSLSEEQIALINELATTWKVANRFSIE
ncbi:hypothetical protein H7Y40_02070 [Pedobacter sp.]|nr:hypothetical protein [Candidatus Saccharibacteria bacterium]